MDYSKKISDLSQKHATAQALVLSTKKQTAKAILHHDDALGALRIFQQTAEIIQQKAHRQISYVVTRCLAVVFDDPYQFQIQFEQKRGRTEARLQFVRRGLVLQDPLDESGGGVVDIASFALRLASLILSRPQRRRCLILDEPFKFVHPPERRPRIVKMIQMLADEFDVQFIIVTGIEELVTGTVIHLDNRQDL